MIVPAIRRTSDTPNERNLDLDLQQRLDIKIVGCLDDIEYHALVDLVETGVPFADLDVAHARRVEFAMIPIKMSAEAGRQWLQESHSSAKAETGSSL